MELVSRFGNLGNIKDCSCPEHSHTPTRAQLGRTTCYAIQLGLLHSLKCIESFPNLGGDRLMPGQGTSIYLQSRKVKATLLGFW